MNQSEFLVISCNFPKRGKRCDWFGFASHWLKIRRNIFKPITKHGNRDRFITFNSPLKTALTRNVHFVLHEYRLITQLFYPMICVRYPVNSA